MRIILIVIKLITSPGWMLETSAQGCTSQVHWEDPEGSGGEGGGRGNWDGECM